MYVSGAWCIKIKIKNIRKCVNTSKNDFKRQITSFFAQRLKLISHKTQAWHDLLPCSPALVTNSCLLSFLLPPHHNIQTCPPFPNNHPMDQSYHVPYDTRIFCMAKKGTQDDRIEHKHLCWGETASSCCENQRIWPCPQNKIWPDQHTHAHPCIQNDSGVSLYPSITVIFQRSPVQHLCSAVTLKNPRCCILQDRIIPYRGTADNRSQCAKAGELSADRVQCILCYIPPRRLIKH